MDTYLLKCVIDFDNIFKLTDNERKLLYADCRRNEGTEKFRSILGLDIVSMSPSFTSISAWFTSMSPSHTHQCLHQFLSKYDCLCRNTPLYVRNPV